jgi:hypothetical protein
VIYLALVMAAMMTRVTLLSALLLGISSNLKIYSGVLFFVFLWRREYRLALSMIVAAVLIATILPIAVFGFSGYVQLLEGWVGQALFYAPPAGEKAVLPADLWREASALIVGNESHSVEASILLRSSQAVWIALVAGYFCLCDKTECLGARTASAARRCLCRPARPVAVQHLVHAISRSRSPARAYAAVDRRRQRSMECPDTLYGTGDVGRLPNHAICDPQ